MIAPASTAGAVILASLLALGSAAVSPARADPGRGAGVMCYVWANSASPTINTPYEPDATYSYNAVGRAQGNSITKIGTGTYDVTCNGVGGGALFSGSGSWGSGGHVEVTAYGNTTNTCHVYDWSTGGANFTAAVQCRTPGGALADTQFDLLFVW